MDQINWGIIGCGDVTEIKSGPALYKTPNSRLAAVMRRDKAKAEDYARRHDVARAYDDAAALIADTDVNAVYVATPPDAHAEWAIAALKAGKPVYVEKPMALTVEECRAMNAASADSGAALSIAYYRRRMPRFEKARALIADGAIGKVRCATLVQRLPRTRGSGQAWKLDPAIGGGGHFIDMQVHALDWLDYVFGPATHIKGRVRRQAGEYDAEDFVSYIADFGDVTVTGQCAYAVGEEADELRIFGETGSLCMSVLQWAPVTLVRGDAKESFNIKDPEHVQAPMIADVVTCFRGEGENPCTGEEAMRTTAFVETLYKEYRESEG